MAGVGAALDTSKKHTNVHQKGAHVRVRLCVCVCLLTACVRACSWWYLWDDEDGCHVGAAHNTNVGDGKRAPGQVRRPETPRHARCLQPVQILCNLKDGLCLHVLRQPRNQSMCAERLPQSTPKLLAMARRTGRAVYGAALLCTWCIGRGAALLVHTWCIG